MTTLLVISMICTVLGIFDVLSFGTFGLVPLEASFALFFIAICKYMIWDGEPLRIPRTPEMYWMGGLWIAAIVSGIAPLTSYEPLRQIQFVKTISHFSLVWLFAVCCSCMPVKAKSWVMVVKLQFTIMLLVCLYGIYQLPARAFNWDGGWMTVTNASYEKMSGADGMQQIALQFGDFYRATSIFSEPSALAGYCVFGITLLIVPFVRRKGFVISRTYAWVVLPVLVLAMFLTFSITGLMLLVGVLIVLAWKYPYRVLRKSFLTLMILGSIVYVGDLVAESIAGISVLKLFDKRLSGLLTGSAAAGETEITGESYSQRSGDYKASIKTFTESPVTGVGMGNFALSYHGSRHDTLYPATTFGTILAEMGIVGIITYFAFIMTIIGSALDLLRRWEAQSSIQSETIEQLIGIMPFIGTLIFVTGINANVLINAYWWFWIGLIVTGLTAARRELGILDVFTILLIRTPFKAKIRFTKRNDSLHDNHPSITI